jgi:hypothetical protein
LLEVAVNVIVRSTSIAVLFEAPAGRPEEALLEGMVGVTRIVVVVTKRFVDVTVVVSAESGVGVMTTVVGSEAVVTVAFSGGGPYSQEVVPLETANGYTPGLDDGAAITPGAVEGVHISVTVSGGAVA